MYDIVRHRTSTKKHTEECRVSNLRMKKGQAETERIPVLKGD